MEKIKLLLVDDRDIIRDCIRILLKRSKQIEIVAEAADGLEALFAVQNVNYDVVLMDYSMPEMNGLEALKGIIDTNPNAKIIIFSFLNNPFEIKTLLDAGALGYINKDSEISVYEEAIKEVFKGNMFLCDKTKQLLAFNALPS
ncbi:MAG: response regulator transcription factor [Flavobacteriales bacterium]|nr:response regulator transcription factor [Flavobacteriales bacterium]MCB9175144.1 response regulator transcription factor [Flavobacteriales bacterium]